MMSSLDVSSLDLSSVVGSLQLGMAVLAYTVAVLVVMVLRKRLRRRIGPELALWSWTVVPLAVIVSQWPHAAVTGAWVRSWHASMQEAAPAATLRGIASTSLLPGLLLVWLAGVLACVALACVAQWRYRQAWRTASRWGRTPRGIETRRTTSNDVGPALIGLWHPRVLVPADFEARFDANEQRLILAHEDMHAARGDATWHLLAFMSFALSWMHPLAWLAWRQFRLDLELACDTAVLRDHTGSRRAYAQALLKSTTAGHALLAGCTWTPVHPITERIAMLTLSPHHLAPRTTARIILLTLGLSVAGAVYAATGAAPAVTHGAREYQVDMSIERAWDIDGKRHAERAVLALCMPAGKAGEVKVHDWSAKAAVTPQADGSLRVDINLADPAVKGDVVSTMQGGAGHLLHGREQRDGREFAFDVTPQAGCPARDKAAHQA